MKITYKFPIEAFNTADGDTRFSVTNYTLELDEEPTEALLALIEKYGGERAPDLEAMADEAKADYEAGNVEPLDLETVEEKHSKAKRSAKKKDGE